jgi:hypothetical protein
VQDGTQVSIARKTTRETTREIIHTFRSKGIKYSFEKGSKMQ